MDSETRRRVLGQYRNLFFGLVTDDVATRFQLPHNCRYSV